MKLFRCIAAATLLVPSLAAAGDPVPDGTTFVANSDDLPSGEKVVCRKNKVIGSRLAAKTVCKTLAQWEVEKRESRQAIEKGQNQRTVTGN